jgi:acetolactate synthase regulatory subunit
MADCRRYRDDLKAWADRELFGPRRFLLRRHLARCASCRDEIQEMTQITEGLRAGEPSDAPLGAALRDKILSDAPPPESVRRPRAPRPLEYAAVLLLVLVMAAVLIPVFSKAREMARNPVAAVATGAATREILPDQQSSGIAHQRILPDVSAADIMTRQVHNQASLGLQVDDPEDKSERIAQMVKDAGGYVADNTLSTNGDGTRTAILTVDVPVAQFDDLLARLSKLGQVQSKDITGEDITDKTSDAQQAERVLEGQADQAQARLAKLGKHGDWDDAQTARELTVQLAEARARLALLHRLGQLSEIDVALTQTPAPAPPVQTGFLHDLGNTTRGATQSLLASTASLLALLIWTLAYAPIWLPLLLIARWVWKRYGLGQTTPAS